MNLNKIQFLNIMITSTILAGPDGLALAKQWPKHVETSEGQISEDDDDEGAQEERDQGPWKVAVPANYRKNRYSLRIGSKLQSLKTSEIMLKDRDLPSMVALIDSYGRVEQRKRTTISPHLLTGFRPRQFRTSFFGGIQKSSSPLEDYLGSAKLSGIYGIEGLYQPGPFGLSIGMDTLTGKTSEYQFKSSQLRLGGCLETGLFAKGPYYRWHQLFHGGVGLSNYQISSALSSSDPNATPLVVKEGIGYGPFVAVDLLYLWQSWWWGARANANQDFAPESGGASLGYGASLVGSFTW